MFFPVGNVAVDDGGWQKVKACSQACKPCIDYSEQSSIDYSGQS
jgi:hypothetical protein